MIVESLQAAKKALNEGLAQIHGGVKLLEQLAASSAAQIEGLDRAIAERQRNLAAVTAQEAQVGQRVEAVLAEARQQADEIRAAAHTAGEADRAALVQSVQAETDQMKATARQAVETAVRERERIEAATTEKATALGDLEAECTRLSGALGAAQHRVRELQDQEAATRAAIAGLHAELGKFQAPA